MLELYKIQQNSLVAVACTQLQPPNGQAKAETPPLFLLVFSHEQTHSKLTRIAK
jgi:hypothetical protein